MLAARLLRQGVPQAEVARQAGVHRQSVSRWAEQLAEGGRKALQKAGRAGRKPRLKTAECGASYADCSAARKRGIRNQSVVCLARGGPDRAGMRGKLHPSQAWRILRQLGWSRQRPWGRALERDEDEIRGWKGKRWVEIKKKPKKKGDPSSSSTKAD